MLADKIWGINVFKGANHETLKDIFDNKNSWANVNEIPDHVIHFAQG